MEQIYEYKVLAHVSDDSIEAHLTVAAKQGYRLVHVVSKASPVLILERPTIVPADQ